MQIRMMQELEAVGRLRAAGFDPRRADVLEARALQRGIMAGIATEEQIRRFRELQEAVRRAAEAERAARMQIRMMQELEAVERLRAAGLDPRRVDILESRALQRGIMAGIASEEQIRRFRELQGALRQLGWQISILDETIDVGRVLAWGAAWTAVYRAFNLLLGVISGATIGAFGRLAQFQQRVLALATELVNLNPGVPFEVAARQARALVEALEDLQPGFIGTSAQLQEILTAAVRFFGDVDLQSQQGREAFLAFANGIVTAQIGIERAGSAFREVAALMEGVQRPGAQFLELLRRLDPQIVKHVQEWRRLGGAELVLRNIGQLLAGQRVLIAEVSNTIQGQINIIERNVARIQRRIAETQVGPIMLALRGVAAVTGVGEGVPQAAIVNLLTGAAVQAAIVAAFRRVGGLAGGAFVAGLGVALRRIVALLGGVPGLIALGAVEAFMVFSDWLNRIERGADATAARVAIVARRTAQATSLLVAGFLTEQARTARAVAEQMEERFRAGEASFADLLQARRAALEEERRELGEILQARDLATGERFEAEQRRAEAKARQILQDELALQREIRLRREAQEALERFLRFEQPAALLEAELSREESLARQVTLRRALLDLRRAELDALRERRVPDDPEQQLAHLRQQLQLRRAIADAEEELRRRMRERAEALARSRAAELRAFGRPALADLIQLGLEEQEALRRVAGDREAVLQVEREFWGRRLELIRTAARAMRQALADAAAAATAAIVEPAELRAEGLRSLLEVLRERVGAERPERMVARFAEAAALIRQQFDTMREALQRALADVQQRRERAPQVPELLRQEADLRIRLIRLVMEQIRAEEALDRERQRALRQEALANEIRLLEQRLELLQRFGGDSTVVEQALARARRLQQLRELGQIPGALEERLGALQRGLQRPGLLPEEAKALREELEDVRRVMAEVAEDVRASAERMQRAQRATQDLTEASQILGRALAAVRDEAQRAAQQTLTDYEQVFGAIRDRLQQMVAWWRQAGEASGKAFRDAILNELRSLPGAPPLPDVRTDGPPPRSRGGTSIFIGHLDISERIDSATLERFVVAVMSAAGDRAVHQDRRWIGDGTVV
jgi:hypothetical protein